MTDTSNWTERESAARRILSHLARTSQSSEEYNNLVSDMQLLRNVPGELLVKAARESNHLHEINFSEDRNNTKSSTTVEEDINPSSRKKSRIEGPGLQILLENDTPNLFALFFGDLGEVMASYISASELCKLDLLNKQFHAFTMNVWKSFAYKRFGMTNGKDGWRAGTSLLREPVFIHINQHPTHGGMRYEGYTIVSSNNSLIAIDSDDYEKNCAPYGISLYDATDLTYLGPRDEPGKQTILAGPTKDGDNLFVKADVRDLSKAITNLTFHRGGISREFVLEDSGFFNCTKLIASETHVLAINGSRANLFKIVPDKLVKLCVSEPLHNLDREKKEYYVTRISWGADKFEFIVYSSLRKRNEFVEALNHTSKIMVFKLDAKTDTISLTQTFSVNEIILREIALGKDFIAGSCEFGKIHIWDRHTKQKIHSCLCDTEQIIGYDPEELFFSVLLSCQGNMLISTSHLGVAICVWDMKTGQLLKRHNHAEEKGVVTMVTGPENGDSAQSMAYAEPLNCYICMSEYMNVWSFPMNQQQMNNAVMIREREEEVSRNHR